MHGVSRRWIQRTEGNVQGKMRGMSERMRSSVQAERGPSRVLQRVFLQTEGRQKVSGIPSFQQSFEIKNRGALKMRPCFF